MKPSEPLIDFIHCHHTHFTGGIFWINCRNPQASLTAIKKVNISILQLLNEQLANNIMHIRLHAEQYLNKYFSPVNIYSQVSNSGRLADNTLIILDSPRMELSDQLQELLRRRNIHIIILVPDKCMDLDSLSNDINCHLNRRIRQVYVKPLEQDCAKMRLVHSLLRNFDSLPGELSHIDERIDSDPEVVDVLCAILEKYRLCESRTGANNIYSVKQRIIFNALTQCDVKILQHIMVEGMPISKNAVLDFIKCSNKDPGLSSLDIYNNLTAMKIFLPYPKLIVCPPSSDIDVNLHSHDYVYIPGFICDYLVGEFARKGAEFRGPRLS